MKIFDQAAARTGLRDHEATTAGYDAVTIQSEAMTTGHQTNAAQPVQRMALGTVMQGKASLGQRRGDVAGE